MAKINIIDGDLFESDAKMIMHQVNCMATMGSGVALQVRQKYQEAYTEYMRISHGKNLELLGAAQIVEDNARYIVNLFGQGKYGYDKKRYTDYKALSRAMNIVSYALEFISPYTEIKEIALPFNMGCDRGGGDWEIVERMIEDVFSSWDGTITICRRENLC